MTSAIDDIKAANDNPRHMAKLHLELTALRQYVLDVEEAKQIVGKKRRWIHYDAAKIDAASRRVKSAVNPPPT